LDLQEFSSKLYFIEQIPKYEMYEICELFPIFQIYEVYEERKLSLEITPQDFH